MVTSGTGPETASFRPNLCQSQRPKSQQAYTRFGLVGFGAQGLSSHHLVILAIVQSFLDVAARFTLEKYKFLYFSRVNIKKAS